MADWDRKHLNFGTFEKTIKEIRSEQLPNWSTGKISSVINLLVRKNFLTRIDKSQIRVENYWLYRSKPMKAEQAYCLVEQGVQPTEQSVQEYERERSAIIGEDIRRIVGKSKPQGISDQNPTPISYPKET